jgi:Fe2+ transport system protein FeoA
MDILEDKKIITLSQAKKGKQYMISEIKGGRSINSHLHAIGIIPDEIIAVINKSAGGPMTISVKGIRIALGRGMAQKILINEITGIEPASNGSK